MQAGKLTEQVEIQELVKGRDPIGQPINEWRPYLTAWADVLFLSGYEAMRADSQVSVTRGSVRIRRRPGRDVKPDMRLIYQGAIHNITAVMPNRRQAYMDLLIETTGETA